MKKTFALLLTATLLSVETYAASERLEVVVESNAALKTAPNLDRLQADEKIDINGKSYVAVTGADGVSRVDVESAGAYSAARPADCWSTDGNGGRYVHLVPAQTYGGEAFDNIYMPMFAASAADGRLTLKSVCGVLKITLKGDADVNCIKVEDNAGGCLAGRFEYDAAAGKAVCGERTAANADALVLDCSNGGKGVGLTAAGRDFYLVMPAREYTEGIKISVTDRAHRIEVYVCAAFEIGAGRVTALKPLVFEPDVDLVFAEHFDNFVYGGDRVGGKDCGGFSPVKNGAEINSRFDGTERAVYGVGFDKAGSGYLQSDHTVKLGANPTMGRDYLANRNVADWNMMFRAQEYRGFIGVGVKDNTRGIVEIPALASLDGLCDIEVSFKVCVQTNANSCVMFSASNVGVIREYWLDGIRHTLQNTNYPYMGNDTECIRLRNGAVAVPRDDKAPKKWHTVRLVIGGATAATTLKWTSEQFSPKYINGFYLDDIEVRLLRSVPRSKILRVMDYNIQNGMWADEPNNYDNFVEYVKTVDPDICVFCEAQTIYYPATHDKCKPEERYLPDHWGELAARFGHNYWGIGAHQDNHPVVITSKYPITVVRKLGGEDIWHGGVYARVEVDGEYVNIVGFHPWPFGYARDVMKNGTEARRRSTEAFGGDMYRLYEMKYFIDSTILDPEYAGEKNWLIMGDTNCPSPLDDALYEHGLESPRYAGNRYILENTPCRDIVKTYCNTDKRDVVPFTTHSHGRIDIMYGTESMMRRVISAKSPNAGFTRAKYNSKMRFYDGSSDHLPVIVDFEWR
ncbi:MAG: hypothetical protein J6K28_01720 [Alistipes sp.]|nr:hypothetical protein [Alistipes sp.]